MDNRGAIMPGQPPGSLVATADTRPLERAILRALAYADVFDYPLVAAEIRRYLPGVAATPYEVCACLASGRMEPRLVARAGRYYTLPGRAEIVATRGRRKVVADRLWPRARHHGAAIARLPFVRMVAVTGALAVDNVEPGADIDYLIVTEPGRLWLCRALVIVLVRLAASRGEIICPNYLLSERALTLPDQTLYTAHELAQMVPLAGWPVYRRMRALNSWVDTWLPNAQEPPRRTEIGTGRPGRIRSGAEALLRTPAAGWIERWEMERKVRKLGRQRGGEIETSFGPDWCKGHFGGHGQQTLAAYHERLRALEEATDE